MKIRIERAKKALNCDDLKCTEGQIIQRGERHVVVDAFGFVSHFHAVCGDRKYGGAISTGLSDEPPESPRDYDNQFVLADVRAGA